MPIRLKAKPFAASKLGVQQGLGDFMSFVARLRADCVFRNVLCNLRDFLVP